MEWGGGRDAAGERNEIRSTRRRQQDQRGGLIKFQRASSSFFFSLFRFHSNPFVRRFPRLLVQVDAQFSGLRRSIPRIFRVPFPDLHACMCAREIEIERKRGKRQKTGMVDEHGSAKIAKMTSASGACWGGCQSGICRAALSRGGIRQSSRWSRQPRALRDNYFRSSS